MFCCIETSSIKQMLLLLLNLASLRTQVQCSQILCYNVTQMDSSPKKKMFQKRKRKKGWEEGRKEGNRSMLATTSECSSGVGGPQAVWQLSPGSQSSTTTRPLHRTKQPDILLSCLCTCLFPQLENWYPCSFF